MQISKFYTYYLKKLFKNGGFGIGAVSLNAVLFGYRWELNKNSGINDFILSRSIPRGDGNIFGRWTLLYFFVNLAFGLVAGFSTISTLTENLISSPKENGEDAFFLSYTSPSKRNDLIISKILAAFTFFMFANLLYSLTAIYWGIKDSHGYLDYLFIFFQITLVPLLFFSLLMFFFLWLTSSLKPKTSRMLVNWIIPIVSSILITLFFIGISRQSRHAAEGRISSIWETGKGLFDNAKGISLGLAIAFLSIGFLFYYLYQKNFQEKDIT